MKKQTAEALASYIKDAKTQTLVVSNPHLGDRGYYVLATHQSRPIESLHRFDCDEFSNESEALELLKP